jgi:cyclic pyranopterin phosphate synthase
MARDRFGRTIDYLRVSLTDMCNLRCVYCMPEDMTSRPQEALLQDGELLRLVRVFAKLGFRKVRLTGGEPTLRESVVGLVEAIAATEGIGEVTMTTNGVLFGRLARPLHAAGLRRVNVSLDTLDPGRFRQLTRWGNIKDVWAGIDAAEAAGMRIKINCVVVRGHNDREDVSGLAGLTRERPWQVRFIEVMPFGGLTDFQRSHIVSEEELRALISAVHGPLKPVNGGALDGEARVFRLDGAAGTLGFISSVSGPFCAACNRVRLTADGRLRLCLLRDKELDLLGLLRGGADDEELGRLVQDTIRLKPWGHGLAEQIFPTKRAMSEIGG